MRIVMRFALILVLMTAMNRVCLADEGSAIAPELPKQMNNTSDYLKAMSFATPSLAEVLRDLYRIESCGKRIEDAPLSEVENDVKSNPRLTILLAMKVLSETRDSNGILAHSKEAESSYAGFIDTLYKAHCVYKGAVKHFENLERTAEKDHQ